MLRRRRKKSRPAPAVASKGLAAQTSPSANLAAIAVQSRTSPVVSQLKSLQNSANRAQPAQRAIIQRWVKADDSLDESSLAANPKYVKTSSQPVFRSDAQAGAVFSSLIGHLPQTTKVMATDAFLATKRGQEAKHGVIKSLPNPPAQVDDPTLFKNGVIDTDALSSSIPKSDPSGTPGVDAVGTLADMTDPFDVAAGRFDRGSLKESDGNGWKVDKDPASMTSTEKDKYEADWGFKHGSEVAAGVGGGIGDLVAIGSVIHNWRARSKNEQTQDLVDMAATGTSLVANATKVVDSSAKVHEGGGSSGVGNDIKVTGNTVVDKYETKGSDLAGKMTGNIADMVGIVASVKDLVVDSIKVYDQIKAKDEASKGDVTKAGVQALVSLLKLAKGITTTVRNFQFTLENAFNTGVAAAVPGIGIAITAIQTILHSYEVAKSIAYFKKMKLKKRRLKDEVEFALDAEAETTGTEFEPKYAWKKRTLPVRGKKNKGRTHSDISGLLAWKIKEFGEKQGQGASDQELEARQKTIDVMKRYKMAKAFEYVNAKTARRGMTNVILDLTSIAGDIATLSGVGAGVGGGLKIASGATRGAMVGARHLKQFGRNRAEKDSAWKVTKKVFNADKSTSAKASDRSAIADMVFDQISNLFTRYRQNKDSWSKSETKDAQERYDEIASYVRAAGLSWKAWSNVTARDPAKGHAMLVSGQKTRG